jgi:hypothetical protein
VRNAVLAPLALAALAACADQPALPERPTAEGATPFATVSVSAPQTVAWNAGDWFAGNVPMPEAGGGRVVWEDASGPLVVRAYDFGTRTQSQVAMVYGDDASPSTAGRWVAWSDEHFIIHLRDLSTGTTRTLGRGWTPHVSAQGRVAYISYDLAAGNNPRNRNVSVYDPATGATRVITRYTDAAGEEAGQPAIDGDLVVWLVNAVWPGTTYALRMFNLATGQERELVRSDRQIATQPWVSGNRVVWTQYNPDRSPGVVVYDAATGARRTITTAAARPGWSPRISGTLVVWEDGRNYSATNRLPENDIYAYDLATGTEMAVATGPNHQGWPSLDGNRVVWTELANGRWEIRTATVQTVSLQALGQAVDGMLASGDIANRGAAQALQAFLAQASRAHGARDVAGERAALRRFRAHVQQLSGKQVRPAAASRLTAMADALLQAISG